ncbi:MULTISPECIES: hypothetical protein [unclassified Streptomyces]|uniref:hypothetical protein n=1 Tax=unclassified Streptomyces TaxID=2593676 RepID=UPI002E2CCB87|nr:MULTISPECIES: hypothetical protein [unclassified Streptomyces]
MDTTVAPPSDTEPTLPRVARAAAQRLGEGWSAEPGEYAATAGLFGPYRSAFRLHVDHDEDLVVGYCRYQGDDFPELDPAELPTGIGICDAGIYLPDVRPSDGVEALADQVARAVRVAAGLPLI